MRDESKRANGGFEHAASSSQQRAPASDLLKLLSGGSVPYRLDEELRASVKLSYAVRRVPEERICSLLPLAVPAQIGDIALAVVRTVGKNTRLELRNGRPSALHDGDLIAVVFGNRYATMQFEGYARSNGGRCDLLSMGGVCGLVASKHAQLADATKLELLGHLADEEGRPLCLRDFAVPPSEAQGARPNVVAVCGSTMDAGKTHTAMSLVLGLRRGGCSVAGIKLTGTATGRDTWRFADAGARLALDFVDGGFPSTYLVSTAELLDLHRRLLSHVAAAGVQWVVVEIADGLLQPETSALLQSPEFVDSVDAWALACGDALAVEASLRQLRKWGLEPGIVSGCVSMSPLAMQEVRGATGVHCLTADALQSGGVNELLARAAAARVERDSRLRQAYA